MLWWHGCLCTSNASTRRHGGNGCTCSWHRHGSWWRSHRLPQVAAGAMLLRRRAVCRCSRNGTRVRQVTAAFLYSLGSCCRVRCCCASSGFTTHARLRGRRLCRSRYIHAAPRRRLGCSCAAVGLTFRSMRHSHTSHAAQCKTPRRRGSRARRAFLREHDSIEC